MRLWRRRKVYLDNLPKTHDMRFMLVFVIALVVVFGALYAVGYAVAGNKLPSGTTVAEVDVGGMTPDQARTVLQEKLAPRLQTTIKASVSGRAYVLDPQRIGLTFDIDATLDKATGGSPWDPRHMLHVLTGGDKLDPVVIVDEQALADRLKRVAARVDQKPVDSKVSFTQTQTTVVYGNAGRALDYQRSGDRLIAALLAGDRAVTLSVKTIQPRITAIQATRFADTVGKRALSGPVRIKVADSAVTIQPREFGPALLATPGRSGLRLGVDQRVLMKRSRNALYGLPHHPVNAAIRFVADKPRIVPGTAGVTVAAEDLEKAMLKAVDQKGDKRVARANALPDNPNVTTDDMRMMRIRERISASSARFQLDDAQGDASAQVRHLDGVLLKPGQTFSYLARMPDAGSPAASFAASLLYGAAFSAGIEAPQHSPGRIYSGEFAPGRDAHVEPPATDLMLQNTSPFGIYIRGYLDNPGRAGSYDRVAHLEMWSTRYWRVRAHASGRYNVVEPQVIKNPQKNCTPRAGVPGFDVDVARMLSRGAHRRTERTHATYAVVDEIRCTRGRPG